MSTVEKFKWVIRVTFTSGGDTSPHSLGILKELEIDIYEPFVEKYLTEKQMAQLFFLDFQVVGTQITINL